MSKIDILNLTNGFRCSPNGNVNVEFNYNYLNEEISSSTIKLYISEDEEFTNPTIVTINNIYVYNNSTYTLHSSNGTINSSVIPGQFKFSFTFPNVNSVRYIKVCITEDTKDYFSSIILLSSNIDLDFKTVPITLENKPNEIIVSDKKTIIDSSNVTISVYATNNALDASPVWENITTEYNNNEFYQFTNDTKTNTNWAISVRYLISKSNYNAGIEIEEIYIGHI